MYCVWQAVKTPTIISKNHVYLCDTTWKREPSDNSGSHLHKRLNKTVISVSKMVIHECFGGTSQESVTCYEILSNLLHNTTETCLSCNSGIMSQICICISRLILGPINLPKIQRPTPNPKHKKGEMQQVTYWRPKILDWQMTHLFGARETDTHFCM